MIVFDNNRVKIIQADARTALGSLEPQSIQMCVTSPPYFQLRDYGFDQQIGREKTISEYIDVMVGVFGHLRDVLRDDGILWLNIGDTFAKRSLKLDGVKKKELMGIPWRLAIALQADGWYLRSDVIWWKTNCKPESVRDRPTIVHEYIFLLTKQEQYYYNQDAIREPFAPETIPRYHRDVSPRHKYIEGAPGQTPQGLHQGRDTPRQYNPLGANKKSIWQIAVTRGYSDQHFAAFPEDLARTCILAGSKEGDMIIDPFAGSGTTLAVAQHLNRCAIGIEGNAEYCTDMIRRLTETGIPMF